MPGGKRDSQVRADESGPARDQQPVQGGRSYHLQSARSDLVALETGEVHVWIGKVPPGREQRTVAARRRATEELLRQILARYLERAPDAIEVERAEGGKPRLNGARGLEFNLSHSGGLVLIALARGREIGVDVERIRPGRDFLTIANRILGEETLSELRAASAEDRAAVFYAAWVRHEARLKCSGGGLGHPAPPGPIAVAGIDVAPGYAAAVAVAGEEVGRLSCRALPPGLPEASAGPEN